MSFESFLKKRLDNKYKVEIVPGTETINSDVHKCLIKLTVKNEKNENMHKYCIVKYYCRSDKQSNKIMTIKFTEESIRVGGLNPNLFYYKKIEQNFQNPEKDSDDDKYIYVLKDFIPGIPLEDFVTTYKAIPRPEKAGTQKIEGEKVQLSQLVKYKIIYGIAKFLADFHSEKRIHTEIRPDTIFIDTKFEPHILGISRFIYNPILDTLDFEKEIGDQTVEKYIRDNVEASYLPPEAKKVTSNKPSTQKEDPDSNNQNEQQGPLLITDRYDTYMFGCTLFFLITSHHPKPDEHGQDNSYLPSESNSQYSKRVYSSETKDSADSIKYFTDYPILRKIVQWCMKEKAEERPAMAQVAEWIYEGAMSVLDPNDFKEFHKYYEKITGECGENGYGTDEKDCIKAQELGFTYLSELQPYLKKLQFSPDNRKNDPQEQFLKAKLENGKKVFIPDHFRTLVAHEDKKETDKKPA